MRYCEKINFRQSRDTPSYAIFLIQNFSEKKGPPSNSFGTVRQKSFERKSWYPPPIQKLFRQRKFSEKRRVPLRNFSLLWENQFSTKSWYTILCNFFKPEVFWSKSVLLGKFFGTLRQKKFQRKSWYRLPIHKKFSIKEIFWKKKGSPKKFFAIVRKSVFDKIMIHHPMQFF